MIMANTQIFHGVNTFVRVSLNHKCFILASLLIIQCKAIPVDKYNKYIVTTTPYTNLTFTYSFDHKINYDASIEHEIKKILSNEIIKNYNRSEEYITTYNGLNDHSNKCNSSDAHVTRVNISDKHNNKEREIKNKLSNKTAINYSKSEEYIKNYNGLNDLNNKCNRSDVHGTKVEKSDEHRIICYGSNANRTKYSEVHEHSSKSTSSVKLCTSLNISKQTPYMASINDSEGLSLLTRKIYGNVLNVTSIYSSLLKYNTNSFQSYEKKATRNNDNKIPYDIFKKYIYHYIRMKIKSIIAHMKFKNERESRQYELNRNNSLICGIHLSRNVKHPNGLKELKTMSGNNKNKKKRFVGTKSYSNSDVYIDPSYNIEQSSGNDSSYGKNQDLDHINNSSLKGYLFGNKSLASSSLVKELKINSDSPSKDRHFMAKHTSKYCSALLKIESSTSKLIATKEVDKINLDTNFDEADSLQVEKLMNMDNPQLLNLVKSLIDREINNNLEDIKIYNGDSGPYDRSKIINPTGYKGYHRPDTGLWFRDDNKEPETAPPENAASPEKGATDSFEPDSDSSTYALEGEPEASSPESPESPESHETDLPPGATTPHNDLEEGPPGHTDYDPEGHGVPDRESNDSSSTGCQSGLCKQTAMTLVITFLSTLVGVLVLVFIIFYLWKQCCSPKPQIIYARPCYEACCQ